MPDEIRREADREKFLDDIEYRLRVKAPPPSSTPVTDRTKNIALVIAVLSPICSGFIAVSYWRGVDATDDRFKKIETEQGVSKSERAELKSDVVALGREDVTIRNERDVLKAGRDQQVKDIFTRLDAMQNFGLRIGNVEGQVNKIGDQLDNGRTERLADRDRMNDRINGIDTKVQILEDRNGGGRPFGERNQMWRGLPRPPSQNPIEAYLQRPVFRVGRP